ncbi:nucleotide-sugar transporter-domain-containing protein [Mycena albidolilacea]|uniref:Nucleotide-sugar transporter-domain-containing protein n=1 Tax=Mycena albidolilacea TaxID=1033008 RepID=A0AAD7EQ57_9AGAR|nr:nucleotide-sugar transporter-domain-containing protein [Mycena albidolilacea]
MYAMNRPPSIHLNIIDPNDRHDGDDEQLGLANDATITSAGPMIWGIPLKYLSLVTLAVQNSALTLIMHYSRVSTPPSRAYSPATAVLVNEMLKGSISLFIALWRIDLPSPDGQASGSLLGRVKRLGGDVFSQDCWKLSIPAILYVIQNNLQFVAVSNLQAATFQVSYQMKILTTAGFSVLLLRKKLTSPQWFALLFLAIGVAVVQIQTGAVRVVRDGVPLEDTHTMNALKGFIAVVIACLTSGLAGVYFEMVLKNSQTDLWVRNVQLSLFSLLPALAPVFYLYASDPQEGWVSALFRNFGGWAWATVLVQVFGGLLTALVIKYSDNILKGFATSLSIVISFMASVALFDFQITLTFVTGSLIVVFATWLYNHQPKRTDFAWALGWAENWRTASSLRSPAVSPYNTLRSSASISRSSSALSLNSLSKPSADDSKDSLLFGR